MLTFTAWTNGRRTAEHDVRRYEVIDQVSTKNSIALLITLTRQAGVDEATTQLVEFPTNILAKRAAEVMALETAFQYAALGRVTIRRTTRTAVCRDSRTRSTRRTRSTGGRSTSGDEYEVPAGRHLSSDRRDPRGGTRRTAASCRPVHARCV